MSLGDLEQDFPHFTRI